MIDPYRDQRHSVEWWEIECRRSLEASRQRRYHRPSRLKLALAYLVLGASLAALLIAPVYLPV